MQLRQAEARSIRRAACGGAGGVTGGQTYDARLGYRGGTPIAVVGERPIEGMRESGLPGRPMPLGYGASFSPGSTCAIRS